MTTNLELTRLRDGSITLDPMLDRLVQFDERSREYPVSELLTRDQTKPRGYRWRVNAWLDQGQEGACVGFSWAHELAARPVEIKGTSFELAYRIYKEAQKIDEWEGEDYEGTSVLAGAKVCQQMGYIGEYRWAFDLDDLVLAIGHLGPAIIGVPWFKGMENPGSCGYLHATGAQTGGHAILVYGVDPKNRTFLLHNSWGRDWGNDGTCKVDYDLMQTLLNGWGEACIPITRMKPVGEAI
jgi:hypothetical protein